MLIPNVACKISVYCPIYPSEDPKKVEHALTNIFEDAKITIDKNSVKASSNNLEMLEKIFEVIHSRKTQRIYRKHLNNNLLDDSTWFYLNKQAAFVNTVALCGEADESPLGPIKVILKSDDIERVIEWLIS
ncbi:MAG: RNA-binding domain-containing protein [Nitrosopumilaceae archaeon]